MKRRKRQRYQEETANNQSMQKVLTRKTTKIWKKKEKTK